MSKCITVLAIENDEILQKAPERTLKLYDFDIFMEINGTFLFWMDNALFDHIKQINTRWTLKIGVIKYKNENKHSQIDNRISDSSCGIDRT